MVFWEHFEFSGGKLGPKMVQNDELWVRLVSIKRLNFEILFIDYLCRLKDVPLVEISANVVIIAGEGPRKPPKGAISWMLYCHENI